jgi:hypothetical protein
VRYEPALYAVVDEISVFGFVEHFAAHESAMYADLAVFFCEFKLCHVTAPFGFTAIHYTLFYI